MSDETKPETKPEKTSKPIWQSKTIWVAVALAVLPIAEALAQLLPEAIPARYVGLGMALLGAVIAALRWATKLPLTALVLAMVLASSGCGGQVDWGRVISAAGVIVQGGHVVTAFTCQALAAAGAPEDDIQRCLQAERAAGKAAQLAPVVVGVAGQWINAGTLQVEGVGQVRVLEVQTACPVQPSDKPPIGFDTSRHE